MAVVSFDLKDPLFQEDAVRKLTIECAEFYLNICDHFYQKVHDLTQDHGGMHHKLTYAEMMRINPDLGIWECRAFLMDISRTDLWEYDFEEETLLLSYYYGKHHLRREAVRRHNELFFEYMMNGSCFSQEERVARRKAEKSEFESRVEQEVQKRLAALPQTPPPASIELPPDPISDSPEQESNQGSLFAVPAETSKASTVREQVNEVFEYWRDLFNKGTTTRLTAKRSTSVRARLQQGYSVEALKMAIKGCSASEFHMGNNDRGRPYNDLTLICRNEDQVEKFIEIANTRTLRERYQAGEELTEQELEHFLEDPKNRTLYWYSERRGGIYSMTEFDAKTKLSEMRRKREFDESQKAYREQVFATQQKMKQDQEEESRRKRAEYAELLKKRDKEDAELHGIAEEFGLKYTPVHGSLRHEK